ncbi:TonB-dependent siderophore receptor [Stutzerimonas kirkiae]|uniref:TonB-dependent siderophore receptor n=1 Tax=Stutzerimonas kirkiae TaxID=2211392 RepID=A0A4Q9RAQ2_9GAMM|nr:TonB-dependent receptor [Stutzerimonas kirkiae]TBU97802.1 TonB-dependent siderophore receptor [Stutzerimonas kirkiae]TBV04956.1 TonB-dependent siderophore receptor [Stutzerimonas kirkiae]
MKPRTFFARNALALAIATIALPTVLAPVQAQAQSQQRFDIQAGALGEALNRFGQQAGILLSYPASLTDGRRSPGLQGQYGVDEGLVRLLAGTGLQAVRQANGGYAVALVEALSLDATQISSRALVGRAVTEGSGSYTSHAMQTATKLPLSIRETPQSVTVITRQRMDDQAMNNLDDVVQNTPGLTVAKSGPVRPGFYARGFEVDNIMYDGLPTSIIGGFTQDTIASADLAIYDRVEIVRGATGLMQGAGNPAAAINLVRKRPTEETRVKVTGSAGSWDRYRMEVDASSGLNRSGTLRGRIVTAYENNNSFQDVVGNERSVIYGTLEADLADSTTLTVGASMQNDNNTNGWGGIPVAADGGDLNLSRSTYLGNTWDYWDQNSTFAFAGLEHRFGNGWKVNLTANKIWARVNLLASKVYLRSGSYDQGVGDYSYVDDQSSYDFHASGPFQLFDRQHELVVGANYREEIFDGHGGGAYTHIGMDLDNWNTGVVPKPNVGETWLQKSDETQQGIYTTVRFSLVDSLKAIVGGRLDWYDYESASVWSEDQYKVTRQVTKYAGLIYDLNERHSLYVSYTDIFKPQNAFDSGNRLLKPIEGKNYEVGIKGEYFGGALNASAAVFRIDQENRSKELDDQSQCPGYADFITCYEAAGKVRSEGVDLELQGAITPNWQLAAGYTFTEAKYRKDADPENQGRLFSSHLPRHLFKMSTIYHLPGEWQRWRVGGALYRQNAIYSKGGNGTTAYHIEQDGYTLVDLSLGFMPTEKLDVQLNLNNAFDKKYYQTLSTSTSQALGLYGNPQNLMLTMKYDF